MKTKERKKALKLKDSAIFERADNNWYVDSPSVSEALFRVESFVGSIHDPCAGMGNILRMANNKGYAVRGSDIRPRPEHFATLPNVLNRNPVDFLSNDAERYSYDSIVMNPPYGVGPGGPGSPRLEELFIDRALHLARGKVAVVLRLSWMAPRITWLKDRGCIRIFVVHPRPSMLPGDNLLNGETPKGGAVDYAWFVFLRGSDTAPTINAAQRMACFDKPNFWTWGVKDAAKSA